MPYTTRIRIENQVIMPRVTLEALDLPLDPLVIYNNPIQNARRQLQVIRRKLFDRQRPVVWWPRRAFPTCRSDVGPIRADVAGIGPMSGRCGCDGAATSLRRRADVAAMALRRRVHGAAMMLRRRCDVAPTSGRRRADVAAMALRRRSDVGPMSLRWRCDVAVMALRRRCAPMHNMRMHIHMSTGHALHGRRQDMMEEPGTSSRRVTHRPGGMSLSTALCTTSL